MIDCLLLCAPKQLYNCKIYNSYIDAVFIGNYNDNEGFVEYNSFKPTFNKFQKWQSF